MLVRVYVFICIGMDVVVSGILGDDIYGNGTLSAPFRTLSAALLACVFGSVRATAEVYTGYWNAAGVAPMFATGMISDGAVIDCEDIHSGALNIILNQ